MEEFSGVNIFLSDTGEVKILIDKKSMDDLSSYVLKPVISLSEVMNIFEVVKFICAKRSIRKDDEKSDEFMGKVIDMLDKIIEENGK